jgi:NAD+ synthase
MKKKELQIALELDLSAEADRIETFIRQKLSDYQRGGVVIGLSGGLDSAVTAALAVRAVGGEKITLVNMPERDSAPVHQWHARQFADHLEARFVVRSITPILRVAGTYRLLPLRFIPFRGLRARLVQFGKQQFLHQEEASLLEDRLLPPENDYIARGNAYAIAKHRMRMVVLYQYAETHNLMVVGAANLTEVLTGTYSKWGVDHCADVMPIAHLYRSQVEELGEFLNLPDYILKKAADPDVMPGVNDKAALLGDFTVVDQILYAIEHGAVPDDLKSDFPAEIVGRLANLRELSRHMRESPYVLNG